MCGLFSRRHAIGGGAGSAFDLMQTSISEVMRQHGRPHPHGNPSAAAQSGDDAGPHRRGLTGLEARV